jgi:hypothetical protein
MQALLLMTALAALAAVAHATAQPGPAWAIINGAAFVFLLVAGFAALLDVDLRLSAPRELVGTALLLMLAFVVGAAALLLAPLQASLLGQIAVATPAYFGALALALLLPRLFDLYDSRLVWPWVLWRHCARSRPTRSPGRTSRASASTSGSRARFSSAMPAATSCCARCMAPGVRACSTTAWTCWPPRPTGT